VREEELICASTKLAEFITPTMALFANTTAADFKKGDIIMFAMGSSSPDRVAPEQTDV